MGNLTALKHKLMGTLRMWAETGGLWSTLGFGEVRVCGGSPKSTTCLG